MIKYDKKVVNNGLIIACGAVLFYQALQHIGAIANFLGLLIKILMPFIIGCAIAFVLNVPMRAIEKFLFPKKKAKAGFRRTVSLFVTFLALFCVLAVVLAVIIPSLSSAVLNIGEALPRAIASVHDWFYNLEASVPSLKDALSTLNLNWDSIASSASNAVKEFGVAMLGTGSNLIRSIITSIGEFLIAFVFSIYILFQKEKLGRQFKQTLYALFPEKVNERILDVLRMSNKNFSSFLSGQVLEAIILGAMFVVSMSILRMPYALLIGILVAVTALVPIVGAFIGCIIGALLIAITSPITAVFFVILFLILQQIEGNLIYPHVIGASVGLPSIWILVAVTLGGKLMGITGMLVFIPLCSVIYAIFRDFINQRLAARKISSDKYEETPE